MRDFDWEGVAQYVYGAVIFAALVVAAVAYFTSGQWIGS